MQNCFLTVFIVLNYWFPENEYIAVIFIYLEDPLLSFLIQNFPGSALLLHYYYSYSQLFKVFLQAPQLISLIRRSAFLTMTHWLLILQLYLENYFSIVLFFILLMRNHLKFYLSTTLVLLSKHLFWHGCFWKGSLSSLKIF